MSILSDKYKWYFKYNCNRDVEKSYHSFWNSPGLDYLEFKLVFRILRYVVK